MSNQTQDLSDDDHFTSDPPSSPLVPTRPVSPCSPVIRPNFFLPRLRTRAPLVVTQAVKENTKVHNVSTIPADVI
jgi:hypothetical protein